jgi:hypothetical protein
MCSKTMCRRCGKATWKGCGNHVEQALAGVSKNQRCTCTGEELAGSKSIGFFLRLRGKVNPGDRSEQLAPGA